MTYLQIKWASQHDWFLTARGNKVLVRGDNGEPNKWFSDYTALRTWAGY